MDAREDGSPDPSKEKAGESNVVHDVETGRDPRTPFFALGGTALILGILFALALGVVVIAYVVGD